MWDAIWLDLNAATLEPNAADLGWISDAALGLADGKITWIGPQRNLPAPAATLAREVHSAGGRMVTPGLIDCHTHVLFGGNRALDFALRAQGVGYQQIAAAGGGIRSTVKQTRELSEDGLVAAALPRVRALLADGVTTLEIKSGYGLDVATELRLLRAARQIGRLLPVDVVPTLLAAHALPPEFAGDRAGYVELLTRELIPEAARQQLAVAVDVFCESIAFTRAECARVLEAARAAGLAVKVHADQLTDMGAAQLAAEFGALSADHLEYTSAAGVAALAGAGTVAVLLPGAYLMTGETRRPPVAALREAGVALAVATDCNPGTSPCTSLTLAGTLGRALFELTAEEALAAVTRSAAQALGLAADRGTLQVGKQADFCLWDLHHPREFAYWLGRNACWASVHRGRLRPRTAEPAVH